MVLAAALLLPEAGMAQLELISSDGFLDSTTVITAVDGTEIDLYIRMRRLVSGPTRTGDISVSRSLSFAAPIAFFSGSMPVDGPYAVPNVPPNPPDMDSLVVTLDVSDGQGYSEKVYRYRVTVIGLQGCIVDCEGVPRVGLAVRFDPVRPDGAIEPRLYPRPFAVPAEDQLISRRQIEVLTDAGGCFEQLLEVNPRMEPDGTRYLVTLADDPAERFLITVPDGLGPVDVEDLLE
jgi:hypothetical protein